FHTGGRRGKRRAGALGSDTEFSRLYRYRHCIPCVDTSRAQESYFVWRIGTRVFTKVGSGRILCPFLNLIRPFQVTREIWKANNPHPDYVNAMAWQYSASSPLIGAWWGTWILSGVLGRLVATFSRDAKTADSLLSLTYFSIVSDIVNLIPAVLVILLIRAINERQEQKHERMKSFWEQRSIQAEQASG